MNPRSIVGAGDPMLGDLHAVRQSWKWVLASGIAFALLGAMALAYSVLMTMASVFVFGWALMFGGMFKAVHAFKVFQWSGFLLELLLAILYMVVGLMMATHPEAGALSITLLVAAFFLIGGLSRIFAGAIFHPPGRLWLLLSGFVTLLLGILILAGWPVSGLWVIGTFVAIDMVFSGVWLIMLAVNARNLPFSKIAGRTMGYSNTTFDEQSSQQ